MNKQKEEKLAEISARITQILDFLGETPNSFASKLGYSRAQTIYDIIKMKCAPSYDFFERFSKSGYSAIIRFDWLLTGTGNMFVESDTEISVSPELDKMVKEYHKEIQKEENTPVDVQFVDVTDREKPSIDYTKGAPYYSVDFIGGFDFVENSQVARPDYFINYPPYNKPGVMWCNISGHSMEPEIDSGDIIALREVNTPIQYLPLGEIYAIVTDEYRTIKRIRLSKKEGYIILIPSNKTCFEEQEIPMDMIRKVFVVLGCIKKFF